MIRASKDNGGRIAMQLL